MTLQNEEFELNKTHWENAREGHINMILQAKMNILLATEALKMCEIELKKFSDE